MERYHFTIHVTMDRSNADLMMKQEWDAEDWGEEWPAWVAGHAFTQCWDKNYAVKMQLEQVDMTGDKRNTVTSEETSEAFEVE